LPTRSRGRSSPAAKSRTTWLPAGPCWSPDWSVRYASFLAVPQTTRTGPWWSPDQADTGIRKGGVAVTEHPARPLGGSSQLLYSVEEAANQLGIGRTFMFHLLGTGEIDSLKIGRRRKIPRDAIDGYIKRLRSEQAANANGPGEARLPDQQDRQRG
jgi:excisionase family DNA binding protein